MDVGGGWRIGHAGRNGNMRPIRRETGFAATLNAPWPNADYPGQDRVEKIRSGAWNADGDPQDRLKIAALVAKGYLEAFRLVKKSVARVLAGEPPGWVVRQDYPD